jgi:hypothetical protein
MGESEYDWQDGKTYTVWRCPNDRGILLKVRQQMPISRLALQGYKFFHIVRLGGNDPIQLEASTLDGNMNMRVRLDVNQARFIVKEIENVLAGKDSGPSPEYYVTMLQLAKVKSTRDKWKLQFQVIPWYMTRNAVSAVYTVVSFIFSSSNDVRKLLSELKKAASHYVKCPACDNWFESWSEIAEHWLAHEGNHRKLVKKFTGKYYTAYDSSNGKKELAAILKGKHQALTRRIDAPI